MLHRKSSSISRTWQSWLILYIVVNRVGRHVGPAPFSTNLAEILKLQILLAQFVNIAC